MTPHGPTWGIKYYCRPILVDFYVKFLAKYTYLVV
jgi:hypothetical protein